MGALRALYAIVVTTALLFWLNQDSIKLYCQQKYHQGCEIPLLGQLPAWRYGAQLTLALEEGRDSFVERLRQAPLLASAPAPQVLPEPAPVVTVNLETPAALAKPLPVAAVVEPVHAVEPVHVPVHVAPPAPVHAEPVQPAVVTQPVQPAVLQPGTVAALASGDEVFLVGDSLMQGWPRTWPTACASATRSAPST